MKKAQLAELFVIQAEVMEMLGVRNSAQYSGPLSTSMVEAAMGIASEAGEVLNAIMTSTKPWKRKTDDQMKKEVLEELVDVLFFVFELYILMFGPDVNGLVRQYANKALILKARVLSSEYTREEIVDAVSRLHNGAVDLEEAHKPLFVLIHQLGEVVPGIFTSPRVFADDPRSFVRSYLEEKK